MSNPYDPWTPATPPRFVGRLSQMRRLEQALEESRSVSLVGDWRIGKSSVLETWAERVRATGRAVCPMSGEGPAGTTIAAFVRDVTGLQSSDNADEAADVLARWVDTVGRPGLPPLILADEADGLFVRFEHRFFERMRGMLGRLCLVLSSRKEIDQICQALGRTSPFLNRLELVCLGLLESEAAEVLIRWEERYFQPGDAGLISDWAGRHPFYLQLVLYHNLSYFPHLFLTNHILLTARTSPALVRQVLDACAITPGQRRIGKTALARLQARELEGLTKQRRFAAIVELQGEWLPGVQGADSILLAFRETARYLAAAQIAGNPYHRLEHLKRAEKSLIALENQLRATHSPLTRALRLTLATWQSTTRELRQKAESVAAGQIPNPFRTDPLTPELGREVFRGREPLAHRIETLLADPRTSASIALLGPRRCGKTSLLKMLPVLLPDAVIVFFDLQDNPVDSPAAFFQALARQAREQAQRDRRLQLPPLPHGPPFEAGSDWFKTLESMAGDHRILICIDEFERLEDLFPGESRELLQLMGLFRATIQHRRRLRLLVSGAAPFDELSALWDDHFVNVRELRVEHLDRSTSLDLLTRPLPEFQAIPESVAERIYQRTGGQPFLLQLCGSLLINLLNDEKRQQATPEDVARVESQILNEGQSSYYFRNIYRSAPEDARTVLEAMALEHDPGEISVHARRWLRRRCLITDDGYPRIPIFYDWIHQELEG